MNLAATVNVVLYDRLLKSRLPPKIMKNAIFLLCTVAFSLFARADEVLVAVAANFAAPKKIASAF